MKLPSFTDLAADQKAVYLRDPTESLLVIGPPGSGKTSMALWRARLLRDPEHKQSVVLVTRNRLLAAVARQWALDEGGSALETTTMHKFLWRHYRDSMGSVIPRQGDYIYVWPKILEDYARKDFKPKLDHLIVDEGQNLPPSFFVWARRYAARSVSIFADEYQATAVEGSQASDFGAAGFTDAIPLLSNHRNTQEIVDFVSQFHTNRLLPKPPASRGSSGEVPRLLKVKTWDDLVAAVATRLTNRGGSVGVIVHRKDEVKHLHALLKAALGGARVDRFVSEMHPGAEDEIQMRSDGVTIISGESATGLEFDAVFLQDLSRSLPTTFPIQSRRLYAFSARARDTLILVDGPTALSAAQLKTLPQPPLLEV